MFSVEGSFSGFLLVKTIFYSYNMNGIGQQAKVYVSPLPEVEGPVIFTTVSERLY